MTVRERSVWLLGDRCNLPEPLRRFNVGKRGARQAGGERKPARLENGALSSYVQVALGVPVFQEKDHSREHDHRHQKLYRSMRAGGQLGGLQPGISRRVLPGRLLQPVDDHPVRYPSAASCPLKTARGGPFEVSCPIAIDALEGGENQGVRMLGIWSGEQARGRHPSLT